ncbi:hypothetical protein GCM10010218_43920 [Streptomyces mashuensis]|uniref:Uncharacterized protein n=1 Tax=Streptomyces mashuensis TaxID=33904 RepID=A0A919B5M5_9ACTN|nr:hypothetical protein GCM10010218_43920 [Streptomyces mashuensis]
MESANEAETMTRLALGQAECQFLVRRAPRQAPAEPPGGPRRKVPYPARSDDTPGRNPDPAPGPPLTLPRSFPGQT